jgi:exodeoxyribonuclease-3
MRILPLLLLTLFAADARALPLRLRSNKPFVPVSVSRSAPERAAFGALLSLGLADSFRLFDQPEKTFSWWDYRMLAFPKNRGLRIDHILLSPPLASRCVASRIDRNARKGEKPSDHAPIMVTLRDV